MNGDRTWLVALAASLWGVSALWRDPLAERFPSLAIVFWEQALLVVLLSPWLVGAVRALAGASRRARWSMVVIGAGSSALATVLFTASFTFGDPVTPQVLQKLQPLIALGLAAVLLGERLRASFFWFAVPALVGAWLVTFPDPTAVSVQHLQAGALAIGAATLWAAGTVLGRRVSTELAFVHITTLRFGIGFVTLAVLAAVTQTSVRIAPDAAGSIALLALIPGLLALLLYYLGLQRTPASRATLAELAFPMTAALVGVTVLGGSQTTTQWVGLVMTVCAVVALALYSQRDRKRPTVVTRDSALRVFETQH